MTEENLNSIVDEIKEDFQLPPYLNDETVMRAVKRCAHRLSKLNPDADFDDEGDATGKSLLVNFAYYELQHQSHEFEKNYEQMILSWQLSAVGSEVEEDEGD